MADANKIAQNETHTIQKKKIYIYKGNFYVKIRGNTTVKVGSPG